MELHCNFFAYCLRCSLLILSMLTLQCLSQNFSWNEFGNFFMLFSPIFGPAPNNLNPMAKMNSEEIIKSSGYLFENHEVITTDGYRINLHRIPYGKFFANSTSPPKASIVVISGILTDGSSFLFNTPENSLGFVLADAGYDVWLLNFRGSYYSRGHVFLNPDTDKKYWNFSFDEIGMKDLPSTVDYVLNITGRQQIYTLGYSMGGASISIMLGENPSYMSKIKASFLVSPAMWFRQPKFKFRHSSLQNLLNTLGNLVDDGEVLQKTDSMVALYQTFCSGIGRKMCIDIIDEIFGHDPYQFNYDRLDVFLAHLISGTSVKTLKHYLQLYKGRFAKFDYGLQLNQQIYCQSFPPDYNIKIIKTPIVFIYGPGDAFVDSIDVRALSGNFLNVLDVIEIKHKNFNHLDFMCAKEAKYYFHDVVVQKLNEIEGNMTSY